MEQYREYKYILIKGVFTNSDGQIVRTLVAYECRIYSSNPEVPLTEDIVNQYLNNIVKYTMEEKLKNKYKYIFKDNTVSLDLGDGVYRTGMILEVHDEPSSEEFKTDASKEAA